MQRLPENKNNQSHFDKSIKSFLCCPCKIQFWKDGMNVIDAMAILPYFVTLGQAKLLGRIIL